MILEVLAIAAALLAILPARMFVKNVWQNFRSPTRPVSGGRPGVSVLIPARDEATTIASALESVLANRNVDLEVLVLDDHSTDATPEVVEVYAERDDRVRLLSAPDLPRGWNGKMHACHVLAEHATRDLLVFIDADVTLSPDALGRMAGFMERSGADLASGIPREVVKTPVEKLVIPLIHFVLLGFLPIGRMRRSTHPMYASGVGQLFVARREAYRRVGGHAAIKGSRHDGVHLPQAFRRAGLRADLFDATELASCRMYHSASEVWQGFLKNADQGMGHPRSIIPMTVLLFGGQVLPLLLLLAWPLLTPVATALTVTAVVALFVPRFLAAERFHQPLLSALLHPVGISVLLLIQWVALVRRAMGRPAVWKGRAYDVG